MSSNIRYPRDIMSESIGDRILCYHGPKLYEAKIIHFKKENNIDKFYVHYKGWKSKWDEWVDINRIVALNSSGLELKKKLATEHNFHELIEKDEASRIEVPVLFKLGKNFKHFANYDWIQITKKHKILYAPAEISVSSFLRQYADSQIEFGTSEFVNNFIIFLDVYIGKCLLYRQERLHYLPLARSKESTSLYGPEILIRFFARLNTILQEFLVHDLITDFSHQFSKLSDHLLKHLNSKDKDLDSAYASRSEHYESYYFMN